MGAGQQQHQGQLTSGSHVLQAAAQQQLWQQQQQSMQALQGAAAVQLLNSAAGGGGQSGLGQEPTAAQLQQIQAALAARQAAAGRAGAQWQHQQQ
jgi:hypothetical protein